MRCDDSENGFHSGTCGGSASPIPTPTSQKFGWWRLSRGIRGWQENGWSVTYREFEVTGRTSEEVSGLWSSKWCCLASVIFWSMPWLSFISNPGKDGMWWSIYRLLIVRHQDTVTWAFQIPVVTPDHICSCLMSSCRCLWRVLVAEFLRSEIRMYVLWKQLGCCSMSMAIDLPNNELTDPSFLVTTFPH